MVVDFLGPVTWHEEARNVRIDALSRAAFLECMVMSLSSIFTGDAGDRKNWVRLKPPFVGVSAPHASTNFGG